MLNKVLAAIFAVMFIFTSACALADSAPVAAGEPAEIETETTETAEAPEAEPEEPEDPDGTDWNSAAVAEYSDAVDAAIIEEAAEEPAAPENAAPAEALESAEPEDSAESAEDTEAAGAWALPDTGGYYPFGGVVTSIDYEAGTATIEACNGGYIWVQEWVDEDVGDILACLVKDGNLICARCTGYNVNNIG